MATMKDKQPDTYEGEKKVWQCINEKLKAESSISAFL